MERCQGCEGQVGASGSLGINARTRCMSLQVCAIKSTYTYLSNSLFIAALWGGVRAELGHMHAMHGRLPYLILVLQLG